VAPVDAAEGSVAVEEEWGGGLCQGAALAAAARGGGGGSERQRRRRAGGAEAELPPLVRVDGVPGHQQRLPGAAPPLVGRVDGGKGVRVLLRLLGGAEAPGGWGDEEQCGGSGRGGPRRGC